MCCLALCHAAPAALLPGCVGSLACRGEDALALGVCCEGVKRVQMVVANAAQSIEQDTAPAAGYNNTVECIALQIPRSDISGISCTAASFETVCWQLMSGMQPLNAQPRLQLCMWQLWSAPANIIP